MIDQLMVNSIDWLMGNLRIVFFGAILLVAVTFAGGLVQGSVTHSSRRSQKPKTGGAASSQKTAKYLIRQVLAKNLQAAQSEDINSYMDTLCPDSPDYASTRAILVKVFALYDLKYTRFNLVFNSISKYKAVVHYTLLTQKANAGGPPFRNNRIKEEAVLRKRGGKWKICGTTTENIEYVK